MNFFPENNMAIPIREGGSLKRLDPTVAPSFSDLHPTRLGEFPSTRPGYTDSEAHFKDF